MENLFSLCSSLLICEAEDVNSVLAFINALKRGEENSILYPSGFILILGVGQIGISFQQNVCMWEKGISYLGFFMLYVSFSYDSFNYDAISGSTGAMSRAEKKSYL